MQYKTFMIPADGNSIPEKDFNLFLKTNRIISIQKEFISLPSAAWCFLVEYLEENNGTKSSKIDYMQVLTKEEFSVFSKLREKRREIAANEKIPPYVVFTDEQLSRIVKAMPATIEALGKINGIGESKAQKFGKQFIEIICNFKSAAEQNEAIF